MNVHYGTCSAHVDIHAFSDECVGWADADHWDRHRVEGRRPLSDEDSPRVHAIHVIAESLHTVGLSQEDAVERIMLLAGTSSKVERLYVTGVVQFLWEDVDRSSSASRQHFIDTGRYLTHDETKEA